MTFFEIRVARKRHVPYTRTGGCEQCLGSIEPGDVYARWSATPHDGDVNQRDHWTHLKVHHPHCPKRQA